MDKKARLPESEKLTLNIGLVDLGQIDLLVQEGFFTNRSDFIRTAIRTQLSSYADTVKQTAARKMLVMGVQDFSVSDLHRLREARQRVAIRALGLVRIAHDVSPELALDTIESIDVLGVLEASAAVKQALTERRR